MPSCKIGVHDADEHTGVGPRQRRDQLAGILERFPRDLEEQPLFADSFALLPLVRSEKNRDRSDRVSLGNLRGDNVAPFDQPGRWLEFRAFKRRLANRFDTSDEKVPVGRRALRTGKTAGNSDDGDRFHHFATTFCTRRRASASIVE